MFNVLQFPNLDAEGWTKTSDPSQAYNCIAWAASDDEKFWWPLAVLNGKATYWPRTAPKKATIPAFVKMFGSRGYKIIRDGNVDLELGYDKIAIYAVEHLPTHAARQLPSGNWSHKMGQNIDLETATVTAVEGPEYGRVVRVLKKRQATYL